MIYVNIYMCTLKHASKKETCKSVHKKVYRLRSESPLHIDIGNI